MEKSDMKLLEDQYLVEIFFAISNSAYLMKQQKRENLLEKSKNGQRLHLLESSIHTHCD